MSIVKKLFNKALMMPEYLKLWHAKFDIPPVDTTIFISHSDFIKSIGGSERVVIKDIGNIESEGRNTLSIFPLFPSSTSSKRARIYCVRINKVLKYCGLFKPILEKLKSFAQIKKFKIHHLMNWHRDDISSIAELIKENNINADFWIHDLFIFSPIPYLIYSAFTKLSIPPPEIDKEYLYNDTLTPQKRDEWRAAFTPLLRLCTTIIVPSEYMAKVMDRNFPAYSDKIFIRPLSNYPLQKKEKTLKSKKRIAFLGHKIPLKGSCFWEQLIKEPSLKGKFVFYHIGGFEKNGPSIHIPYSVKDEGEDAAVKKLLENEIDMVFLWSIIPESYSYTLYEALSAGVFVLTCDKSGNIAYEIGKRNGKAGLVFSTEKELIEYLNNI